MLVTKNEIEKTLTKDSNLTVKKTDYFKIPEHLIISDDELNIRSDYGNIEELMLSIVESGVKIPLSGYKKGDGYILTDGFRRMRAVRLAVSLGHDVGLIPFICEPKGYNQDDRFFDMLTKNDGKNLTPLEQGELFKKIVSRGFEVSQISKRSGKSESYIRDMIKVATVPQVLKNEIISGNISASEVSEMQNTIKDEEKIIETYNKAREKKVETGNVNSKVTHKDIKSVSVEYEEKELSLDKTTRKIEKILNYMKLPIVTDAYDIDIPIIAIDALLKFLKNGNKKNPDLFVKELLDALRS